MKLNDNELKAFRIFDSQQVAEIKKGVDTGVDVSLYADTRFDCEQMEEILLGLQQGADVSLYSDPDRYYAAQMILGSEFYIIPNSVHQLILVKKEFAEELPGSLALMIQEVNRTSLSVQEVLSDHPYLYRDGKIEAVA